MCEIDNKTITNETSILLGKNIVYFRQLNNWSQDTLSTKLGSDKAYLSQIENAKRSASTEYIDRLCRVFNIKAEELFKERNFDLKKRVDSKK